MNSISIKNISKHFIIHEKRHVPLYQDIINGLLKQRQQKVIKAIDNVTLEIKKGEKIGIIGANGSGKTTLLRLIAGIYVPTEGTCVTEGGIAAFLQSGISMTPYLSVTDNIELYGAIIGLSSAQIKRSMDEIIDFAELRGYEYMQLQLLSSGMQQRVFFSVLTQTMHYRAANIFIFDESLSAGDKKFSEKSEKFLKHLKNSQKTILFASHSDEQIKAVCSKVIYLENGKLQRFDSTETVMDDYLKK